MNDIVISKCVDIVQDRGLVVTSVSSSSTNRSVVSNKTLESKSNVF